MNYSLLTLVALAIVNVAAAGLLGGFADVSPRNENVQLAANEALRVMNQDTDDSVQIEVTSAQQQVIAGMKYKLTLDVTVNGVTQGQCTVEVVSLVYEPGVMRVNSRHPEEACFQYVNKPVSYSVHHRRERRSARLLGGKEELDLSEPGVQEAANWAVDYINGQSNSMYRHALQKIAQGTRQVVNGYLYKFLLYLVSTTCRNNKDNLGKSLEDCPVNDMPMPQQCDVSVVFSNQEYSMHELACKPLKAEHVLGGDDHDYKPHGNAKPLIGGDGHDYKPHGNAKPIIGGDGHDYKPHGNAKPIIGGDGHDYKPHGNAKPIIGGDDHDYKPHGIEKPLIGGDGHDYKPHGNAKPLIGGDGHDYKPHGIGKNLLGQDWHDYIPHLKTNLHGLMKSAGKDTKDNLLGIGKNIIQKAQVASKMHILGGDTHDYQPHDPCQQYRGEFEEFKSKHQRVYGSEREETERFQIFCGNMERVKEYQKMELGSAVYGATQFADISEAEFKDKYLGWKKNPNSARTWPPADIPKGPIPDAWDWRDHNAVTPVKNQGTCGSCWAFSTTGNIEGRNAIKHKKLVSLSEQELLDCDKVDEACNGGLPSQAYEALMELGGIETEKDYSYDAAKENCHFNKSEVVVKLTGAVNISKNEDDMAAWLVKNGPISIGINAFAMQFYFGGIAHPWKIFCNPSNLDHGVLIVGYGKDGSEPYWIVKNSWGGSWGRQGYYYVYRGDGTCGLNTMCTSAVVE